MTLSSNNGSTMPVLDMSDEARAQRIGLRVLEMARQHGWPDDGEGAFEYIQRQSYVVGYEDAGGKIRYGSENTGTRWPVSALVATECEKLHAENQALRSQMAYIAAYDLKEVANYDADRQWALLHTIVTTAKGVISKLYGYTAKIDTSEGDK